jgi:indolepyruvate ferredoxin oxidoreductase, beta subunit
MNARTNEVRPTTIAIFALGGEGGGVLADWIVDLASHGGYLAQATSVPGVAQRTGATVYYVELFPKAAAHAAGCDPVFALMPVPGDVEIVIASELMEAARAVERGFVIPARTTLVASTHRAFAMTEKIALADGRADFTALLTACRAAAKTMVAFDMTDVADATGSVISAVLFGALAGSKALPFPRMAFEAAIRRGGVGVEGSLRAFAAGFEAASSGTPVATPKPHEEGADAVIAAGVARLVDYQDAAYAEDYRSRLKLIEDIERRRGDGSERLLTETARQLALAMAYEDTVRVAELKIRAQRFQRVREEAQTGQGQILEIAEFFHPRTQEIADTLPVSLGRWLMRTGWARAIADRFTHKGRVVKTTSLGGFGMLYVLAKMKRHRRRSLRFLTEQESLDPWLELVAATARVDYALAVEVARARTLVKGYGDTHARGRAKFDRLLAVLPELQRRPDPSGSAKALIAAALADENSDVLEKAIAALAKAPAISTELRAASL